MILSLTSITSRYRSKDGKSQIKVDEYQGWKPEHNAILMATRVHAHTHNTSQEKLEKLLMAQSSEVIGMYGTLKYVMGAALRGGFCLTMHSLDEEHQLQPLHLILSLSHASGTKQP